MNPDFNKKNSINIKFYIILYDIIDIIKVFIPKKKKK